MNCKPGDLAVTHSMRFPENNGRIVEVLRRADPWELTGDAAPAWVVRSLGTPLLRSSYGRPIPPSMERPIDDSRLKPLRDPGDDARDETLDWLPVPTKELA